VSEGVSFDSALSLLTLRSIRRYVRRSHAVMMTAFFSVLYALGSMTLGGMLIFAHIGGGYTFEVLWRSQTGFQSWNYPGLFIVAPWGIVSLPFFATVAMVLVSIGVGIGMSVAVLLGIALLRRRAKSAQQPVAVGTLAGLTPAMIALLTLGACCSTTAAATAGVGLVAQVSGSSTDTLLLNNWYLGVFQVAVVWIALLAQELLLRVYGGLFGLSTDASPGATAPSPPRLTRRSLVGGALRVALLVGGVTWSLAMLVDWTTVGPASASLADWVRWVVQHQLLALLAILAALFPRGLFEAFSRRAGTLWGGLSRALLLVGGLSLAVGVPPPLAGWGVDGFGNELMALLGVPTAWGAVAPVLSPGLDLYFRWVVQYFLLGGFAIAVAIAPLRALSVVRWSVGERSSAWPNGPGRDVAGAPSPTASAPAFRELLPSAEVSSTGTTAAPSR
jgi:hypothetical protein